MIGRVGACPRPGGRKALPYILAVLLICSSVAADSGKAKLGRPASWFKLKNLTDTATFTHRSIRGRPTILVVGRTKRAAPPCKKWMLALIKRYRKEGPKVLQVIVIKKPWYLPRALILKQVRGFIPARHHDKVLLEWFTVFSDVWGIPKVDDPFIYLLDKKGVIRFMHRGAADKAALQQLGDAIKGLPSPPLIPKP